MYQFFTESLTEIQTVRKSCTKQAYSTQKYIKKRNSILYLSRLIAWDKLGRTHISQVLLEPASNLISKNEGKKSEQIEGKLLGESVSVCGVGFHKVQLIFRSISSCRGCRDSPSCTAGQGVTEGWALPGAWGRCSPEGWVWGGLH